MNEKAQKAQEETETRDAGPEETRTQELGNGVEFKFTFKDKALNRDKILADTAKLVRMALLLNDDVSDAGIERAREVASLALVIDTFCYAMGHEHETATASILKDASIYLEKREAYLQSLPPEKRAEELAREQRLALRQLHGATLPSLPGVFRSTDVAVERILSVTSRVTIALVEANARLTAGGLAAVKVTDDDSDGDTVARDYLNELMNALSSAATDGDGDETTDSDSAAPAAP